MEEWKEYKIKDVTSILGDGIHGTPKYDDVGPVFFINGNNLENGKIVIKENTKRVSLEEANKHKKPLTERTLFVSINGTLGNVARYNGESCILGKSACYFNVKEEFDLDFIYYVVANSEFRNEIERLATGTTIKNVSLETMRNYTFYAPSLKLQKQIASILKSLDDKIEVNRKINENLEQQAQALFKSWLSCCHYKISIADLSLNITDYTKCNQDRVVLVNSSDVTEGAFMHHNLSENHGLKGHFKKRFQKGDILYSQVRPRNRHWGYCNFEADNYLASTQLMVIRNREGVIPSILLYQYIIDDKVWMDFTLRTETRSGTFPQGNYEDLSSIKVSFGADMDKISLSLEKLYAMIHSNNQESRSLAELRDTLLPRLMSGELKVNEIVA